MLLWLGLWAFTAEGEGLIPNWETKIPQAVWRDQKKFLIKILKAKMKSTLLQEIFSDPLAFQNNPLFSESLKHYWLYSLDM